MGKNSITEQQRTALREWYRRQYPRPRQKACQQWFLSTFNHQISQSTVSESLGDHFRHLDAVPSTSRASSSTSKPIYRHRTGQWPKLEEILFDWQQLIEKRGGNTSGDILIEKAKQIWLEIPEYQHVPQPDFSSGWLTRFKERHHIKTHINHGEASSVPDQAVIEMRALQTICGEYQEEDIYNMDETGLFWKKSPSRGLSSRPQRGVKQDKSRISIVICTNCSGTDRLPLWFIGRYQQPRPLRGINITALGAVYQANQKSWMTGLIMRDWLIAFYQHILSSRKILLLLDNFPAHTAGIDLAPPPPHIRIQFLPANSTSIFQPLDQGIIQNFKVFYRKQWLQFILQKLENQQDPYQHVTLLHAIRWSIRSWNHDVTNSTIYNCFRKSTVIQPQIQLPQDPPIDLSHLYCQVQDAGQIQDIMSLSNFLNPEEEDMVSIDNHDDPLQSILAHHLGTDVQLNVEEEEGEALTPKPVPTTKEALLAIEVLGDYLLHQDTSTASDIRVLDRLERFLQAQSVPTVQRTLDSWVM
jgi:hypothetical protein